MRIAVPLLAAILLVSGCTPVVAGGPPREPGAPVHEVSGAAIGTDAATPDSEEDVLGWEDGYWYNASIAVDRSDGLNASELDAIVARTMARVERIRRLEFERAVPVEVRSRTAFRARRNRSVSRALRIFDNAKFEALFLVNESTDSIAVQQRNAASSIVGFYSPDRNAIVLVADADGRPSIDEYTLAHELVHALQAQHFGLAAFDARTRDGRNAQDALIEGDAAYVEYLYRRHCRNGWSCLPPTDGASGDVANLGVYLLKYFPYSDGPAFVRGVHERGGWAAVNDLYARPPTSTEQVIHPETYREDVPVRLDIDSPFVSSPAKTPENDTGVGNGTRTDGTPAPTPTERANEPPGGRNGSTPTVTNATGSPTATDVTTATPSGRNASTPTVTDGSTPTSSDVTNGTRESTPSNATNGSTPTASSTPDAIPTPPHTDRTPPEPTDGRSPAVEGTPTPTSRIEWARVRPPGRPDYATVGEAGIATMFVYPTYHGDGGAVLVSPDEFVNSRDGALSAIDPFDYDQTYSAGWDGDRLLVYRNDRGETGYVWRIAWDSRRDARQFVRGYRRLLAYWGGERVADGVYRVPDGGFEDAFHLETDGSRVTIVNAPTVRQLAALTADVDAVDDGPLRELTVDGSGRASDVESPISTRQPGFGPLVALVGVAIALFLRVRRTT